MLQKNLLDAGAPTAQRLLAWPPSAEELTQALSPDWSAPVTEFLANAQGRALSARLQERLAAGAVIFPADPFRALRLTALADVRVVILGQDPYHGAGQAEGLAFSVPPGVPCPPSLRNVFKELQRDLGVSVPANGSLLHWARQGVLLLNTCLTVEAGQAASHARWGWEGLTDALIRLVSAQAASCVFMLWGAHAWTKAAIIDSQRHLLLKANHPSPLSALRPPLPFMGCGHFGLANGFLEAAGRSGVVWAPTPTP